MWKELEFIPIHGYSATARFVFIASYGFFQRIFTTVTVDIVNTCSYTRLMPLNPLGLVASKRPILLASPGRRLFAGVKSDAVS